MNNMDAPKLKIAILGLSVTSSWGNGHATTYRGLMRGLSELGHDVLFLERNKPWYAQNRDLPRPPYGRTELYSSLTELKDCFEKDIRLADVVIVGSYVPDGVKVGQWVLRTARGIKCFYDIDTPVTINALARGDTGYISASQISRYDLYLSFTGGPILKKIERQFQSPAARVLYCSVDSDYYAPSYRELKWELGYLGTYSADRQPKLDELLLTPAKARRSAQFVVAGSLYPALLTWPANVQRIDHVAPSCHRSFYNSQRFTLNLTRADMVLAGYSPSVRLFEAAACGTPIISDYWEGLNDLLRIDSEVLVARTHDDVLRLLRTVSEEQCISIGRKARARILRQHTFQIRARQLECYLCEQLERQVRSESRRAVLSTAGLSARLADAS